MNIQKMKCEGCQKYRVTASHWIYIPTPDGQDVQDYDFAQYCVECSRTPLFCWYLFAGWTIRGNRFVPEAPQAPAALEQPSPQK